MFGNYIRSMPKLNDADERSKNKSAPPGSRSTNLKYSGGPTGSGKASQSTRCQKCEKFGHFTYNCPVKAVPYKSRPSRTQQLINPKVKRQEPSVEVPEEFLSKKGVAAKILEKNEQVRREKQLSSGNAKPSKRDGKKKKTSDSESDSTSSTSTDTSSDADSDSDSDSDSSSSSSSSSDSDFSSSSDSDGSSSSSDSGRPVKERSNRDRKRPSSSRSSTPSSPANRPYRDRPNDSYSRSRAQIPSRSPSPVRRSKRRSRTPPSSSDEAQKRSRAHRREGRSYGSRHQSRR